MRFQYGGKRISLQGMTNPHKQINGNKVERILKGSKHEPKGLPPLRVHDHIPLVPEIEQQVEKMLHAHSIASREGQIPNSIIDELLDELHARYFSKLDLCKGYRWIRKGGCYGGVAKPKTPKALEDFWGF
ncbi:hypothetical protein AAG906_003178 [Vitis piasezkii]